ncbi:MAG: 2-oxoglutarate dehydrogenase E2 component (dihydrolipoamide succinyltransferase) [Pseudohongiellaceae bacterium]|jgi:2-oxoglutarate dehydrogenase E2 component (dihydrolipoamide succinyltransferase)
MAIEIKAPTFPESVQDGTIATWHKEVGDTVSRDDLLVEIETDKVVLEVVAPADGVLSEIVKREGDIILSNEVLALIGDAVPTSSSAPSAAAKVDSAVAADSPAEIKTPTFPESVQDGTIASWHKATGDSVSRDELIVEIETDKVVLEVVAPADGVMGDIIKVEGDVVLSGELIAYVLEGAPAAAVVAIAESVETTTGDVVASPSARKLAAEKGLDLNVIKATGKGGLITREDVESASQVQVAPVIPAAAPKLTPAVKAPVATATPALVNTGGRIEKRVPMTRLRKLIAQRLLQATSSTAMLTTFNEVNMEPVMTLRKKYKDQFEKTHNGTRLGFMGFFVKAAVEALKRYPAVNASIDGDDVVYHGYQDISVAVSTEKGLVVPVLRNAENMGLADIESGIRDFGMRARDGKLGIDEMTGGTFTITNGGVFGSLLSTPILNPPQTAILGMHKIQERPMAVDGQVVIQPIMYLALSYDHRMVDGKEAVQFLVAIKDLLEDPARILLEI